MIADQCALIAEGTHCDKHTRIAVSSQNQPYACSNAEARTCGKVGQRHRHILVLRRGRDLAGG